MTVHFIFENISRETVGGKQSPGSHIAPGAQRETNSVASAGSPSPLATWLNSPERECPEPFIHDDSVREIAAFAFFIVCAFAGPIAVAAAIMFFG